MFDFLDWGKNMAITTNELAGVSPFLAYSAGVFFILAALMGVYMLRRVLQKKENDMFVTLLHFVAGATVFALLIMQLVAGNASGDAMHADEAGLLPAALLAVGVVLALGGFVWRNRLNKNRSTKLILVHATAALTAGGVLTLAILEL